MYILHVNKYMSNTFKWIEDLIFEKFWFHLTGWIKEFVHAINYLPDSISSLSLQWLTFFFASSFLWNMLKTYKSILSQICKALSFIIILFF